MPSSWTHNSEYSLEGGGNVRILCVAAHPDDEILGVGGTLARHAANGDEVHVVILSDGVTARHEEITEEVAAEIDHRRSRAERACDHLGVRSVSFHEFPDNEFDTVALLDLVQTVETEIESFDPDWIYTHHYGDLNVDHELTSRAVVTATRPLPETSVERVYAFEVLSSTEWSIPEPGNAFQPTEFVNVDGHVEAKLTALREYEAELRDHPHPRTVENVRRNLRSWGAKSGLETAEAFELLRAVRR